MSDGFGFGDGDLLDGVDAPSRDAGIHREQSLRSRQAHEAWRLWATETGRSDAARPTSQFIHAYLEQLRGGRIHEYLLDVVRGAARMPINANNLDDTRRVMNAIKTVSTSRVAVSALREDLPVVPYPHGDRCALRSTVAEVAEACRIEPRLWTERDQEAAGILMELLDASELEKSATLASRATGTVEVLPTDILRSARSTSTRRAPTAKSPGAARSTYAAGIAERERVHGVDFSLDDLAQKMLMRGDDSSRITKVHAMAPDGYWDAVFTLALDGHSNAVAYRMLQEQFAGFHPDQRKG